MASNTIELYCREVGKGLELPKLRRKKLIAGLRQDLEDSHTSRSPEWQDLCAELGNPNEVAETMMANVSFREKTRYRVRRKWAAGLVIAALVALMVIISGYFVQKEKSNIVSAQRLIVDNGTVYATEGDFTNVP